MLARPLLMLVLGAMLAGCATMRSAETANRDRVIVIVGASSGFGKGVALRLADQRARLVLAARRIELLEELARACEQRGAQAVAVRADVGEEKDVAAVARTALDRFGRIDVWINMAGTGVVGRYEDVPLEDHLRLVDVNLKGVMSGSHHALRVFRQQRSGTLINMASMAGRIGLPYYASYSATKHALVGLGVALNQELRLNGEDGIHVSTIMPAASETPWLQHGANYSGHEITMVLMDPPEKIVDAVVRATVAPQPEVPVGYKAKAVAVSHRMMRRTTEDIVGFVMHDALTDAPPAPNTPGNLYEPVYEGTGIRRD